MDYQEWFNWFLDRFDFGDRGLALILMNGKEYGYTGLNPETFAKIREAAIFTGRFSECPDEDGAKDEKAFFVKSRKCAGIPYPKQLEAK